MQVLRNKSQGRSHDRWVPSVLWLPGNQRFEAFAIVPRHAGWQNFAWSSSQAKDRQTKSWWNMERLHSMADASKHCLWSDQVAGSAEMSSSTCWLYPSWQGRNPEEKFVGKTCHFEKDGEAHLEDLLTCYATVTYQKTRSNFGIHRLKTDVEPEM